MKDRTVCLLGLIVNRLGNQSYGKRRNEGMGFSVRPSGVTLGNNMHSIIETPASPAEAK